MGELRTRADNRVCAERVRALDSVRSFDRYLLSDEVLKQMGFLNDVVTGFEPATPRRILVYGIEGVGKSSFAATAFDSPIFLDVEDGVRDIDCCRIAVKSFDDALGILRELYSSDEHSYKTVVIDSLDFLETLVWEGVCNEHGKGSIESFGYGRGYQFALGRWQQLCAGLDALRERREMGVVSIAHAKAERCEPPDGDTYDRWAPRLHKLASARIVEWCDEVWFASYEAFTKKIDDSFKERSIAVGTGRRILQTCAKPSHVAKSRLKIPDQVELSRDGVWKYLTQQQEKKNGV